jgi:hypothetical protein
MSSSDKAPRKFRIEGSGRMLAALAQAIELALRAARATPSRNGAGTAAHGSIAIEVEAMNHDRDDLRYVITSTDDAASTIAGWAGPYPTGLGFFFFRAVPLSRIRSL